jgi:uracil-DNA glycosylase
MTTSELARLADTIVACRRCPRLVRYREQVARTKKREFASWTYWGRPVPGFGDPRAELLIVGLAPAAHGANRTGRMFTGDSSGRWLFRALHRHGFANQPESVHRDDGLRVRNAYITAVVRCAPPDNRPAPDEMANCAGYLRREFPLLPRVRVIVALGQIAFTQVLALAEGEGMTVPRPRPRFSHGALCLLHGRGGPVELIASYHPSRQNTQTGRLTETMLDEVFRRAALSLARTPAQTRKRTLPRD